VALSGEVLSGGDVRSVGALASEKSAPDNCPVPGPSVRCVLEARGQPTVGVHRTIVRCSFLLSGAVLAREEKLPTVGNGWGVV
jgi:hypothetical protein